MSIFQESISECIWNLKYRYFYHQDYIDQNIEDTWQRVAKAIAKVEHVNHRSHWQKKFYSILENFYFLPGGRILAGAGTQHRVTLFNCFVMPVTDSLVSIFNALKEGALTLQQGGGIGYDFSTLRPAGYPTSQSGGTASGPISFMRIWNAMCATMQSTGARRGAMMGMLRCDHPDIEEFIAAKSDPKELRHFNVSIIVTDDFMNAVKQNHEWQLVFPTDEKTNDTVHRRWSGSSEKIACRIIKTVKARVLWEKIISAAYQYAEPGVAFEDTINQQNNLWYNEWISATNPCGEIPLPAYGACNLGSMNLTQFVLNPYTDHATMDWLSLEKMTEVATRFLDNVIDASRYPLKVQKQQAFLTRRIGLGMSGLADALVMMNLPYGSKAALQFAERIMKLISETTWRISVELAKERGAFPLFDDEKYLQGNFVKSLPSDLFLNIKKYGVRNSHHNTIAPTGTISLLANNISNGIEPIFSSHYERTVRQASGTLLTFAVKDYALRVWQDQLKNNHLPPAWQDIQTLMPQHHLQMQAVMQSFIDNAISKTINIPENFPFEQLLEVYTQAYELGLKGCTVFRPNSITGSVLQMVQPEDDVDKCCF